ncbi:O-fucosyltransferase family protein [Rhynchospora pubera]|uniref:O-fucosyltransferase family protein n=1 Tax=Rhynchospora pubera TaxID=906938 RepID=A0AAV8D6K2_9POAL|nr:O-fucosyltransferase family protein [Rhynchospora pubera]
MAKSLAGGGRRRAGLRAWVVRVGSSIVIWTAVMHLMQILGPASWQPRLPKTWPSAACLDRRDPLRPNSTSMDAAAAALGEDGGAHLSPPALLPRRLYKSNGYLRVTCNGGLNQMRAAICDMVTVARYLNLTLVVPELDKTSFWADPSDFGDIFDVDHFINSLRDEVKIVRALPQKIKRKGNREPLSMQPISWSSEKYYLRQILPLIRRHKVMHFNRSDARLANNGIPMRLQKLRCRVNYEALRFTPQIEELGSKLVALLLQRSSSFVVLHLRYEMDMLAFSGCSHGCSERETEELTRMRYAYPWWKEKEIDSEKKRLDGLCPLTPEETALVLKALGFSSDTLIYIASGEIFGGEARMASLRAEFPKIVRKEMLLSEEELRPFRNHSTQMAALDYLVSIASDVFIPTYDGNMAKVVEGHRRYTGFHKTILLDRRKIVELLDLLQDEELSWDEFTESMRELHKDRMGQPTRRNVLLGRPKEEDYFYSNPQECLAVPQRRYPHENSNANNKLRDSDI